MKTKVRKQIYIEASQESRLKQLAGTTGLSEAEIIRQAITRHIQPVSATKSDVSTWERERTFIKQLIAEGPVPGTRNWQRAELYER